MISKMYVAAALGATALSASAYAQDTYISVSGGVVLLNDSSNDGAFVGDFTTGAGTTVPAGAVLPNGTDVGWTTEFDTGWAVSGAIGRSYGPLRGELEVAYQSVGVDTHSGVSAGGIALDAEDAGVLITGSGNLGVSVGDLVAAGEGDLDTIFVMANAFYDFDMGGPLTPYIGGGVGVGFVDVEYAPSATTIIDDDATVFAYQAMAGVAYEVTPTMDLFAGYRYRATTDAEVDATLFSASFDVENKGSIVEAGLRVRF